MGGYEIRRFQPRDERSLLECFHAAFPKPESERRTRAEWSWAFERNPAGQRIFVALSDGAVVAQYAALPERVWIDGSERIFAQIVDSMVHPDHRRGLQRPGLFVHTARAFFDAFGGIDRDWVHYGWPVPGALRIGRRFLDYETVRTQNALVLPGPVPRCETPSEVAPLRHTGLELRWLWDRCAGDFGAGALRNAQYFDWRFASHPVHEYASLGVRDSEGVLRGYAVYRKADWVLPDLGLVVDWLVPPAETEVAELLLRALRARAALDGVRALVALFPEWSFWFELFQERGFRVHPTDYAMVARNFHPRFDIAWLREHWWYQLADTDLV
jgi:hypothetical protein